MSAFPEQSVGRDMCIGTPGVKLLHFRTGTSKVTYWHILPYFFQDIGLLSQTHQLHIQRISTGSWHFDEQEEEL